MLIRIDHIGVAVRNLENSLAFYKSMGANAYHFEEVPSQKVKVAFIKVGESDIELLEPTSEDSPIFKYLEKKGEGIHHICYDVEDLQGALEILKREGFQLINDTPQKGAHHKLVAFVHPKSTNGVLTELSMDEE